MMSLNIRSRSFNLTVTNNIFLFFFWGGVRQTSLHVCRLHNAPCYNAKLVQRSELLLLQRWRQGLLQCLRLDLNCHDKSVEVRCAPNLELCRGARAVFTTVEFDQHASNTNASTARPSTAKGTRKLTQTNVPTRTAFDFTARLE